MSKLVVLLVRKWCTYFTEFMVGFAGYIPTKHRLVIIKGSNLLCICNKIHLSSTFQTGVSTQESSLNPTYFRNTS